MDLAGVDLNLLVAFDALMDERSVTRAASRLSLSQPGMSNALARLRKLFGDPLLVREGLALVPTPRAEALRQPVRDALAIIRGALDPRTGFDPAADRATLDRELLRLQPAHAHRPAGPPPGRRGARRHHPGAAARARPGPAAPRRRGRPRHRARRDHARRAAGQPAAVRRPVAVLRLGGQRGRGRADDLDAYLRLGHLVYSMGRGQPASIVDQHLERSRVPRRIEFTVESFLLAPFLLEGTDLVTVVPERAVPHLRRTADIRVLEPPVRPARDHRDAVVAPAAHRQPRARLDPRPHRRDRRRARPGPGGPREGIRTRGASARAAAALIKRIRRRAQPGPGCSKAGLPGLGQPGWRATRWPGSAACPRAPRRTGRARPSPS